MEVAQMINEPRILEQPVVGFLSRFQPEKGASVYLKVAQQIPHALFLVVARSLGEYAYQNLPENVVYAGFYPREKLPLLYNTFDIYCFPSMSGEETFGLTLLEAMACGVPPIVPNFDGLPSVVGDAGIIVEAEKFGSDIGSFAGYVSPIKLAQAVQTLLQDGIQRSRLAEKTRQRALMYTWDMTARKILDLFEELNLKRKLSRKGNFLTQFIPTINLTADTFESQAVLVNITERLEHPLMRVWYPQTVEEGLALSLMKRHTLHEVEAVLVHICENTKVVSEIIKKIQGFLDATS